VQRRGQKVPKDKKNPGEEKKSVKKGRLDQQKGGIERGIREENTKLDTTINF